MKAPGSWIAAAQSLGRNIAWVSHLAPGLVVRHCGHPTALRPYWIDGVDDQTKYYSLAKAQDAAIAFSAGRPAEEPAILERLVRERTASSSQAYLFAV